MTRQFYSSDLAFAGRCKSDDVRRWRKDGLLADIGERRRDAIYFDRVEVVWVAIGHFLQRCGLGLTAGFKVISRERVATIPDDLAGNHVTVIPIEPELNDGDYVSQPGLKSPTGHLTVDLAAIARLTLHRAEWPQSRSGTSCRDRRATPGIRFPKVRGLMFDIP